MHYHLTSLSLHTALLYSSSFRFLALHDLHSESSLWGIRMPPALYVYLDKKVPCTLLTLYIRQTIY